MRNIKVTISSSQRLLNNLTDAPGTIIRQEKKKGKKKKYNPGSRSISYKWEIFKLPFQVHGD